MHLHEYQAKEVLKRFGVPVPRGIHISTIDEVDAALTKLGITQAVVKIQVHAGGRGKAGGVKIGKTPDEIKQAVKVMLGMKMVNAQTGPEGIVAGSVLLSPITSILKEYYVGAVIDRDKAQAILILSPEGGMDIEEVAEKNPDRIKTIPISKDGSLIPNDLSEALAFMGWDHEVAFKAQKVIKSIAKAFVETDASLLEINPFVMTGDKEFIALDAKMTIDDNALFRQQELLQYYDPTQLSIYEAKAREFDLAYVALNGNIGCMVNGAGLAMATMDIIHYYGGHPANFLDVGGGASEEKIAEGFKIILSDSKVKSILINIFGGIMNCGTLASGIVAATKHAKLHVPLIVRMEGTNVEEGKRTLANSGLDIIVADTLKDAAEKAVAAAL